MLKLIKIVGHQSKPRSLKCRHYSKDVEKISIQPRIERGPTDILRALCNTVSKDPTAAHYKFHDDPFFIPMSNVGKRTFAMAQEAGRKAAKWIVNENAHLFQHTLSDPPIKAYTPKEVYSDGSDVGEETLLKVIQAGQVTDATIVYQLLQKKAVNIADSTKQALLELLCFYNCEDTLPEDQIEERWFSSSNRLEYERKTWKDYGLPEQLFKELKESPQSYAALIQGMLKYGQYERGWQLYEESQQKDITLCTNTYNALIPTAIYLKQNAELRWQQVQDLLSSMAKLGVVPDLGTLNATLQTIASSKSSLQLMLSTLAEFKLLGVEPSLATFYYILMLVYRQDKGTPSTILYDIVDWVEHKHFTIRHAKDIMFFSTAMEVCCNSLRDLALARRIDDLLHLGNNYDLIGDSFKESTYYRYFFLLLVQSENLNKFMEVYDRLVPNIYTPEPAVMLEILKAVDLNGAMEYFARLWSDMVIFDHSDRINLLTFLLDALVRNQPADGDSLVSTFSAIALDIWNKIENQSPNRTNRISWSGEMLSNVLILMTRAGDFDKASAVMNKLNNQQNSFIGEPSVESLCAYVDLCISANKVSHALTCLEFCSDLGFPEVNSMAKQIESQLDLNEAQLKTLQRITGTSGST